MNLLVGTSGYSYKEWKGGFYPEDLPSTEMLRQYGTQLPAVETNNTFYRLPRARWSSLTDTINPSESISTANWGYVRFPDVNQTDSQLPKWLERFAGHHWDSVFAFFKHEEST